MKPQLQGNLTALTDTVRHQNSHMYRYLHIIKNNVWGGGGWKKKAGTKRFQMRVREEHMWRENRSKETRQDWGAEMGKDMGYEYEQHNRCKEHTTIKLVTSLTN